MFAATTNGDGWNWRTLAWMMRHGVWECRRQKPFKLCAGYFWYDGPIFYLSLGAVYISLSCN